MERAPLHETTLLRNGDGATLTVYHGKVNKNVLLLSTLHSTIDIGTNCKKLPETVQFYNKKCGVDILDQMARRYSTRAAACRWPVHVFYNILDLAAINAWIIYRGVTEEKQTGMPFSVSLLRNYGRYTKRNMNLWFQNTMKSSCRTKEKQAKGISVK